VFAINVIEHTGKGADHKGAYQQHVWMAYRPFVGEKYIIRDLRVQAEKVEYDVFKKTHIVTLKDYETMPSRYRDTVAKFLEWSRVGE
jgi:hypothetical protein